MAHHASHLSRVRLIKNPNYKASGIKSYVYLLKKCETHQSLRYV